MISATLGGAAAFAVGGRSARADDWDAWLRDFRQRARQEGVSPNVADKVLRGLQPTQRVIELDQRQAGGKPSWASYRDRVVSAQRVSTGVRRLEENRSVLEAIRSRYNISPAVVCALWGVESSYGGFTGNFAVPDSLATLAWEGRRREMFERELVAALKIIQRGDIAYSGMLGSWAGAMGQCQFMPTTYLNYAVDFDGDGRRDIWNSTPDVLASIANYITSAGWNGRYIWGREVMVPNGTPTGLDRRLSLAAWQRMGVRTIDGGFLPDADIDASVVTTDDGLGQSYLVYQNFKTLMVWNRSTYFALSVGLLADELSAATNS